MKHRSLFLLLFITPLLLLPLLVGCEQCPHNELTQTVIEPSCDQEGYTLNTCTECDYSFRSDITPPPGHAFTEEIVPPTCDESGHVLKHCTTCNVSYKSNFTEPLGHTLSETEVPPTCDHEGYTEVLCSVCKWSYQCDFVAPNGHQFSSSIVYPSRPTNGAITKTCPCGYSYTNALMYSDVFSGAVVSNQTILAKGVDVSVWQHKKDDNGNYLPLNWNAIRDAGFEFAILKAGSTPRTVEIDGQPVATGGIDPVFEMNYQAAKEAGLELGVYFYTYATTLDRVKEDATLLMSWLDGKQLEYPVYFDLEDSTLADLDKETLTEFSITFLSTLQENGYYGALYSNNDWLVNRLNSTVLKSAFDIWYARYPLSTEVTPTASFTWNTATYGAQLGMWQYTSNGVIGAIGDDIRFDFNYVYRDYPSIIKRFGYNGYAPEL